MDIFLISIAVILLLPLVLGPVLVRSGQWVSANFAVKAVDAGSLDEQVRTFLEQARGEFEAIQFEFVGYLTLEDYMPNVVSSFALFLDRQNRTAAMAAVIRHKSGKTVPYYEFTSKYANGRVINVNNSPVRGSFRNPSKSTYRYPKIASLRRLHDIHRWVTGRDQKAIDPAPFDRVRMAETVTEALLGEVRLQQEFGYLRLDQAAKRFRFTWKGALVMTWKNVFPIKPVLDQLDLGAARRAIAAMPAGPEPVSPGKPEVLGAGLRNEEQYKSGASWFFWIAALSFVNSLASQFGGSWNFVIGLGTTQVIDSFAGAARALDPDIVFQTILLLLDLGFAAFFAACGIAARKGSLDSYEVGTVFYALDSLLFLLVFDLIGILFHGIALFFLVRGWNGLRRLQDGRTRPAPASG